MFLHHGPVESGLSEFLHKRDIAAGISGSGLTSPVATGKKISHYLYSEKYLLSPAGAINTKVPGFMDILLITTW
jgi:hypothetical protein